MCGRRSSRRIVLIAAYAVFTSKCDASIIETFAHGVELRAASHRSTCVRRARQVNQPIVGACPEEIRVDGRRRHGVDDAASRPPPPGVPRYTPTFEGASQRSRERSGLIAVHVCPPVSRLPQHVDASSRVCGSVGENSTGAVRRTRKFWSRGRCDVLHLAGPAVVARDCPP